MFNGITVPGIGGRITTANLFRRWVRGNGHDTESYASTTLERVLRNEDTQYQTIKLIGPIIWIGLR